MPDTVWLDTKDVENLGIPLRTIQRKCKNGDFVVRSLPGKGRGGLCYKIDLKSLPPESQLKYLDTKGIDITPETNDPQTDADVYASLTDWQKKTVDKFLSIYQLTKHLRGDELKQFLNVRKEQNPGDAWSYGNYMKIKAKYESGGLLSIVPRWGSRSGESVVPDIYYNKFKELYLKEGGPGHISCWKDVLGYASIIDSNFDAATFPSHMAFLRRLQNEIPDTAIFLKRHGFAKWNRKHGYSISRDYSDLLAGECWVSDHAQVDVAVQMPDGSVKFPWVTAWMDVKTTKLLGWLIHPEGPNSDHIFLAFFRAGVKYGIPRNVILDNGKDYRCRDFAGGRNWRLLKVSIEEQRCRSLLQSLEITPHFCWPYNAQAKPIERTFSKINAGFARHMLGYRGPDTVRRPESLVKEIDGNKIWTYQEFCTNFENYITHIYNREQSSGKVLAGRCPDQLWDEEYQRAITESRVRPVGEDALKMFCMRTSGPYQVRKNIVHDGMYKLNYYAPWMVVENGSSVYMRRDPENFAIAWFWECGTNRELGRAELDTNVPFLAEDEFQKSKLAERIRRKQQITKITKNLGHVSISATANADHITNRIAAVNVLNAKSGYIPTAQDVKGIQVLATEMDRAIALEKRRKESGRFEYDQFADDNLAATGTDDDIDLWNTKAVGL